MPKTKNKWKVKDKIKDLFSVRDLLLTFCFASIEVIVL